MSTFNVNAKNPDFSGNSRLYEFLATRYDISNLANRIAADKDAPGNILKLKNIVNGNDRLA